MDEELLRTLEETKTQLSNIVQQVESEASNRGLLPSEAEARSNDLDPSYYRSGKLNPQDNETVRVLIWEFIVQGLLVPGNDLQSQTGLPWLRVTPYGKAMFQKGEITPYSPENYLGRVRELSERVDPRVFTYLEEAVEAFRRNLFLSCAVYLAL